MQAKLIDLTTLFKYNCLNNVTLVNIIRNPLILYSLIINMNRIMKKYICLFLTVLMGLNSCSKDDDKQQEIPQLNKLTKVTCIKNNSASPEFVLTITYNQGQKIADITQEGKYTHVFTYNANQLIVNSFAAASTASPVLVKKMNYVLSGGGIVKSEEHLKNSYKNDEEYLANIYSYSYNRNNLTGCSWDEANWPKEDGTGYDNRKSLETSTYTWENNNISLYKKGTKEMAFTYKNELQSETFPLLFVNTFNPTIPDVVSPLNFSFGNRNRNLVETVYTYELPDVGNLHTKYTFTYNTTGEYVTGMSVTEEVFPASGQAAETNTYSYSFEYNYK